MRIVRTFHGARTDVAQSSITPAGAQGSEGWDYTRRKKLNSPFGGDGLIARSPCRSGTTGSSSIRS